MAVGVKVVNRPGSLSQQAYLPAIAEGLGVTFRHFVKNFFGNITGQPQEDRHRDDRVPGGEEGVPGAPPRPAPPDAARRRPGPLRRLHDVPDGLPRPLHHHRRRGGARRPHREAPEDLRDRRAALRGLRPVRRGLPVRRDPHGHAASTPSRPTAASTRILDKEELMSRGTTSTAVQGGVGAFWREKVASAPQTPPAGDVVPAGPPRGPVT